VRAGHFSMILTDLMMKMVIFKINIETGLVLKNIEQNSMQYIKE